MNYTYLWLVFDQRIHVTESFYPKVSLSKFFSDLGGSLGLWLGVGAVQLFLHGFNFISYFISWTGNRKGSSNI